MLFDDQRENRADRALRIAEISDAPLWFIGDLHGDLLALEAALALIDRESEREGHGPARIVLLGDLFDDGGYGLETLLRVFELMLQRRRTCASLPAITTRRSVTTGRASRRPCPHRISPTSSTRISRTSGLAAPAKLAVRIVADAPRALFFPDGLLVAHGGFPLRDLHERLAADAATGTIRSV